jgi:hypothetical protein
MPRNTGSDSGMTDMRSRALPHGLSALIVGVLLHWIEILPEIAGAQHVPLWNIVGPHAGKLNRAPRGPGFFRLNEFYRNRAMV